MSDFDLDKIVANEPPFAIDDYDELLAERDALRAEVADLLNGAEYQAMQRTLMEVNERLAEVESAREVQDAALMNLQNRYANVTAENFGLSARLAEAERDVALLNWADSTGHHDCLYDSLRDELRDEARKYRAPIDAARATDAKEGT